MALITPTLSESSLNASDSTTSHDIDEETRNIFKDYKAMSKDELSIAIEKCKDLITDAEEMSPQRIWLIRKLIGLRYRLANINALRENFKKDEDLTIAGHNFQVQKQVPSKRMFCDFCCNIIWIFQGCLSCVDCTFSVHSKCIKYVTRTCAHILVSEKGRPEYRICPEIGLSMQMYRCASCSILFMNKLCFIEPRKCHYTGLFYCKSCHWNDYSIIPANIIHNWDFEQRPVSRQSLQEINLFYERAVIRLEELNPKIFVFVQKLGNIRQKRLALMEMKRYLDVCKFALKQKLVDAIAGSRRYMVQSTEYFSLYDLVCAENSSLYEYLNDIFLKFKSHIMKCEICRGQGFICELCGNNDPIYPFNEGVFKCETCSTCFHRTCIMGGLRRQCPKCERLKEKRKSPDSTIK